MSKKEFQFNSLQEAADEMITQIRSVWTNPFNSPVVIFPDSKLEQWFRLYWIKKCGTLANLNSMRINEFLMYILSTDEMSEKLVLDRLKDIVLFYLYKNASSLCDEYKSLHNYLYNPDDTLNENHLFDFSRQLANLFLEYEIARPETDNKKSLISTWDNDESYFNDCENEDWQKKIYRDIFTSSDDKESFISFFDKNLKTIPRIYEGIKDKQLKAVNSLPVFMFGFTKLGSAYEKLLSDYALNNELYYYCQTAHIKIPSELKISVTASPSVIREVECLHSKIAVLLKNGARFDDIAVVSPDMESYRNAIIQVFSHTLEEDSLNIPFNILDVSSSNSDVNNGIKALFDMLNEESVTRPAFFNLVRNRFVQHIRGISEEETDIWNSWVSLMNVYRDRKEKSEDWKDCVKRLLLARFTDEVIKTQDNKELKPFATIDTNNDDMLCHFVECLDDLEELIAFKKNNPCITEDNLDEVKKHFDRWLYLDSSSHKYEADILIYNDVIKAVESLKLLFACGVKEVSWRLIYLMVNEASLLSSYSTGKLFINGVSMYKFAANRVIPVKYLFFIGANSKVFPGKDTRDTLDLTQKYPWPDEQSESERNKNAFFRQLMCTTHSLDISYRSIDLTKDEELYISSIINEIKKRAVVEMTAIPLDEKRDTSLLFTSRQMRNKSLYKKLMTEVKLSYQDTEEDVDYEIKDKDKYPDRVSVYSLNKFLQDPLRFKIENITYADEKNGLAEQDLLEPYELDSLDSSSCVKRFSSEKLLDGKDYNESDYYKELVLQGKKPDGDFGELQIKEIVSSAERVIELMDGEYSPKNKNQQWVYDKTIDDLVITDEKDKTKWTLTGKIDWFYSESEVKKHIAFITSNISNIDKWITPFVDALAVIAGEKHSSPVTVDITSYQYTSDKSELQTVCLTPPQARERLNRIYSLAYKEQYCKAVPASLTGKEYKKYGDLVGDLYGFSGKWKFFEKRDLLDKNKDLGFSKKQSFKAQWDKESAQQKALFNGFSYMMEGK